MNRYIIIYHTSWQNNNYGADFREHVELLKSVNDWLDACKACTADVIIFDTKKQIVFCSESAEVKKTRDKFKWYMEA